MKSGLQLRVADEEKNVYEIIRVVACDADDYLSFIHSLTLLNPNEYLRCNEILMIIFERIRKHSAAIIKI
jgi:hypothetical protein